MTGTESSLYPLQSKDIRPAAAVLADAFQHDPVWNAILGDTRQATRELTFEMPVRYGLRYGKVYASSENLEGVASWLPGELSSMTFWRILRSGALWTGLKMDANLARKMGPVFAPIEADRKEHMQGRPYIYLQIIGVAQAFQGQGHGRRLIRALIQESQQSGLPIYLETETEENVRMYERFGFRVIQEIVLPVVELSMWEMVRE
jgi:ribosomal protein S18 acetylase RimI-like enzyme